MEELKLYVVKNKEGKYFRAKGYEGSGDNWVDTLAKAKIYTKLSYARRQVTFWANYSPEYGIPVIVVLTATVTDILKEDERVQKVKEEKILSEHRQKLYNAEQKLRVAQNDINRAKKEMEEAKKTLNNA